MNGQAFLSAVLASLWLGALWPAALLVTQAWPRLAARERHTLWWVVLLVIVCSLPLWTEGRNHGTTERVTEGRKDEDGATVRCGSVRHSVGPSFRPTRRGGQCAHPHPGL